MNCKKKHFHFKGNSLFICRNFQHLGCPSTIKLKNNTYPLIDGKTRLYMYLISGLLSKTVSTSYMNESWSVFFVQSKMADLSAYRDQQFKVIIFPLIFKFTLLIKLLFQGLTICVLPCRFLGHARRVRKKVGNECDIVRGKFVVLHNGRTDLRVILASWGPKKDHYGTR